MAYDPFLFFYPTNVLEKMGQNQTKVRLYASPPFHKMSIPSQCGYFIRHLNRRMQMKTKSYLLLFSLAIVLLSVGFMAGSAGAASQDCFTDVTTHWAENFICWMKDNGLTSGYPDGTFKPDNSITRAEVAVFIQKLHDFVVAKDATTLADAKTYADTQDAATLASAQAYADANMTGGVTINAGNTLWVPNAGGTQRISSLINYAEFRPPTGNNGTYAYVASVPVPSVLYGTGMYLDGFRLCYDATDAGTSLVSARIYLVDGASGGISNQFLDNTVRTDNLCRTYSLPAATLFHADDYVFIFLNVDFNGTNDFFRIRSLNINLHPSPTGETVLKQPGEDVTPLMPFTEEP